MTDRSRDIALRKRSNAISDLSRLSILNDGLTFDEAIKAGVFRVNANHQLGIATATEVGLPMSRYPIRVIIDNGAAHRKAVDVDTCASYWVITTAANAPLNFQRRPLRSEVAIANLYRHFPDLDNTLWNVYRDIKEASRATKRDIVKVFDPNGAAFQETIHAVLLMPSPTAENVTALNESMKAVLDEAVASCRIPFIKIDDDYFIRAIPHGVHAKAHGGLSANAVVLRECFLMLKVNYDMMRKRYAALPDGTVALGAYAATAMFREGLWEAYEHREFVTLTVAGTGKDSAKYTVSGIDAPDGYEVDESLRVGSEIDVTGVRINEIMSQLGTLMVYVAGLMHYMFNHTTGGTRMCGVMYTTCLLYNFAGRDAVPEELEEITSLLYEALHPVNKRAIANLFFPSAKVYTHGRMRGAYAYEKIECDAFASIRRNPYPAGSHKAFVATQALKKVINSGMAAFLPWAGQMNSMVETCRDVLSQGARSHIGSSYYTGFPPASSASGLDEYLPDLARFMQTFHPNDSLMGSPHLGVDVATRASVQWSALLKEVKAKDVSSVSADVVKEYLAATGIGSFDFDPDNKETWAIAAKRGSEALAVINNIFM